MKKLFTILMTLSLVAMVAFARPPVPDKSEDKTIYAYNIEDNFSAQLEVAQVNAEISNLATAESDLILADVSGNDEMKIYSVVLNDVMNLEDDIPIPKQVNHDTGHRNRSYAKVIKKVDPYPTGIVRRC